MTTCRHGHLWTEANTYRAPDGVKKRCRQCQYDQRIRKGSTVCPHCGGSKPHVKTWCSDCCVDEADYRRLKAYDLARPEFEAMYFEQDGACLICRASEATHVDHDHATGQVRGLLCHNCNAALGHFMDDPIRMARAIVYVGEFSGDDSGHC